MNKELLVHLFHIILVGGLFLYVSIKNASMPKFMFPFLIFLGIFINFKFYLHGFLNYELNFDNFLYKTNFLQEY